MNEKKTLNDRQQPKLRGDEVSNRIYLFFRKGGFYPLELIDNEDAISNANMNKGTLKVEDKKELSKLKTKKGILSGLITTIYVQNVGIMLQLPCLDGKIQLLVKTITKKESDFV